MAHQFTEAERQILRAQGMMTGLKTLVSRGLSQADASYYLSGWIGGNMMMHRVPEAEKEIKHIQIALSRLNQLGQSIERDLNLRFSDPRITQFMQTLDEFDGWTVSLLETVFTTITALDPNRARTKFAELNTAMTALLDKRNADLPWAKDSVLFKKYVAS